MTVGKAEISWAPRLPQSLIRRLYEMDARGIQDVELLDEVGWALKARCESFIEAVAAVRGRARCAACGRVIVHQGDPEQMLRCDDCGWEITWRDYFKTIQHRQLSGDVQVVSLFQGFIERFPQANSYAEKMLLVDCLIHGFHWNLRTGPRRTTGVNLIEGNYHQVVEFLDNLTYGEGSSPGMREQYADWQSKMNYTADTWGDERLRRSPK